jgi:hypothetical protein
MTSINNTLFNIHNQAPAMLQVGGGRTENYQNLAALTEGLWDENPWAALGTATNRAEDTVSLAYKGIAQKVIAEMAGLTAEAIRDDPSLDEDYLIVLIDSGAGREARVYRRSEILADLDEGLEKQILEAQMAAYPLQVFGSPEGLPPGSSDPSCQNLAAQLNSFLKTNAKTINTLKSAAFDPFQEHQGPSAVKKALTALAAA